METTPDEQLETVDFDDFWRKHTAKKPRKAITVFGETITLPRALPLRFELEAKRLNKSKNPDDIGLMVDILLGEGEHARLVEAGLDTDQLSVLLAWVPQYIGGAEVTLAQVAADIEEMQAAGEA